MSASLPDAAARARIRDDLDATVLVEAGAGTGKTTALVGRIVAMIARGRLTAMARLAAITFTEAAAAELRERIRRELEQAASDPARTGLERARLADAAKDVDLAAIQTIHGFANRLLAADPLGAGLPPGFQVLEQIESEVEFRERFRRWVIEEAERSAPVREGLGRALALGMTFKHLTALAHRLDDHLDALVAPDHTWPTPQSWVDPIPLAREIGRFLTDLTSPESMGQALVSTDAMAVRLRELRPVASLLLDVDEEIAALGALARLELPGGNTGRVANWVAGSLSSIKNSLKEQSTHLSEARTDWRRCALLALLPALTSALREAYAERGRRGRVTFTDLLVRARDLLRLRPEARDAARARFDVLFVDEFQDTDPLQTEIVWRLTSRDPIGPHEPWQDTTPDSGRLFIVGDPKQSIYRFRRADLALYDAVRARFPEANRLTLATNFRSTRTILAFVNALLPEDFAHQTGIQPPYVHLLPPPYLPEGGARVIVAGRPHPTIGEARRAEADLAVATIRAAKGQWRVGGDAGRLARYADMCVLIPTRVSLPALERAFDAAAIPYRVASGTLVLQTQEVRDLLNCLRAIDDASDQVACVAALRTPAFGCSDRDLLRWREANGRFAYLPPREDLAASDDPAIGRVAAAMEGLRAYHRLRSDLSAPALIERFIEERLLAIHALASPHPQEAMRRLRYVAARAQALAATGRIGLRAFIDWIEDLQQEDFRDLDEVFRTDILLPDEPDPDAEDVVQIRTMHGAKGLEFPIVMLCGLGNPRANSARSAWVHRDDLGHCEVRTGNQKVSFETEGFAATAAREKQHEEAERRRLLYVATTRAREYLILSLHRRETRTSNPEIHAERIAARLPDIGSILWTDRIPDSPPLNGTDEAHPIPEPDAVAIDAHRVSEEAWVTARQATIARAARSVTVATTALGAHDAPEVTRSEVPGMEPPTDDPDPEEPTPRPLARPRSQRAATELGEAVHRAIALCARDGVDSAVAARQALAEVGASTGSSLPPAPTDLAYVRALADRALASPALREALASPRRWWEYDVAMLAGDRVIVGRIDLLYEIAPGRLGIIDFKTDRVTGAMLAGRLAEHRFQVGLYALALTRALPGTAVETIALLFPALEGESGVHTAIVSDVPPLLAEVTARLDATPD